MSSNASINLFAFNAKSQSAFPSITPPSVYSGLTTLTSELCKQPTTLFPSTVALRVTRSVAENEKVFGSSDKTPRVYAFLGPEFGGRKNKRTVIFTKVATVKQGAKSIVLLTATMGAKPENAPPCKPSEKYPCPLDKGEPEPCGFVHGEECFQHADKLLAAVSGGKLTKLHTYAVPDTISWLSECVKSAPLFQKRFQEEVTLGKKYFAARKAAAAQLEKQLEAPKVEAVEPEPEPEAPKVKAVESKPEPEVKGVDPLFLIKPARELTLAEAEELVQLLKQGKDLSCWAGL
jgi:hypothetical protein